MYPSSNPRSAAPAACTLVRCWGAASRTELIAAAAAGITGGITAGIAAAVAGIGGARIGSTHPRARTAAAGVLLVAAAADPAAAAAETAEAARSAIAAEGMVAGFTDRGAIAGKQVGGVAVEVVMRFDQAGLHGRVGGAVGMDMHDHIGATQRQRRGRCLDDHAAMRHLT